MFINPAACMVNIKLLTLHAHVRPFIVHVCAHPRPVVGLGPRTVEETAHFRKLISSRGHNVVEPSFIPPHPYAPEHPRTHHRTAACC